MKPVRKVKPTIFTPEQLETIRMENLEEALRQILDYCHPTIDKEIIAIAKEALQ